MEITTFKAAELATQWHQAIHEKDQAALAMENVPTSDPTERWLAFRCWNAAGIPAHHLEHARNFQIIDNGSEMATAIRFVNDRRIVELTVNESGVTSLWKATMAGHEDHNLQRNAAATLTAQGTHVEVLSKWMKHGSERVLALSHRPNTKVFINDGRITLSIQASQVPGQATMTCGPTATRSGWQREIIEATGKLAATMGCPELEDEIIERLSKAKRMPPGGRWIGQMYQQASQLLQHMTVADDGHLYMPRQYEHAKYDNKQLTSITGKRIKRRYISSLDGYMSQKCVLRETIRDQSGRISDQTLHMGARVPTFVRAWLRQTGRFPKHDEPLLIGSRLLNGLQPGEVNPAQLP